MAVPKQKHTKSRRDKRRMHLYIKERSLAVCPKCGKSILSHTVCQNCGNYKGMEVIDVMKKLNKKEKKQKEKEIEQEENKKENQEKGLSWEKMSKK